MRSFFVSMLVMLTLPSWASGQEASTEEKPFDPRLAPYAAFEAGIGQIDEDTIVTTRAVAGMSLGVPTVGCEPGRPCETLLRFALQAPIRLVVADAPPEQDGLIRAEDWDRPGDYLRILRTLSYGRPEEALHFRGGELTLRTLGHGTIVDGYTNVLRPDRFEFGLTSNINTRYGGLEFLLDDVTEPQVVGGRLFVRPWGFTESNDFLRSVAMGFTLMTDVHAPTTLAVTGDSYEVAEDGQPVVEEAETTYAAGFDLEFGSANSSAFTLTHYFDGNIVGESPGFHVGTLADIAITPRFELALRGEIRALGRGYIPAYFSPLHEIDRFTYLGWGVDLPAPKRRVAASITDSSVGGLIGFDVRILPWFMLGASYAGHRGVANDNLTLSLDVGPVGPVRLGAYYFRQNFDSFSEAFDLDGSLAVGEVRSAIWGPLYAFGTYMRSWRLQPDAGYVTVDDWNVGAGASFTF